MTIGLPESVAAMGSGRSGLYQGTKGSSQPYAPSYRVLPDMRKHDKEIGIYGNDGYTINPTATKLIDAVSGNYIEGKDNNRIYTYVIDGYGRIIIGHRNGNGSRGDPTPHPTLLGGKDPKVKVAGLLDVRGGKIYSYDDRSGHYKPSAKSLEAADKAFGKLPKSLFHKNFKKGNR